MAVHFRRIEMLCVRFEKIFKAIVLCLREVIICRFSESKYEVKIIIVAV